MLIFPHDQIARHRLFVPERDVEFWLARRQESASGRYDWWYFRTMPVVDQERGADVGRTIESAWSLTTLAMESPEEPDMCLEDLNQRVRQADIFASRNDAAWAADHFHEFEFVRRAQ